MIDDYNSVSMMFKMQHPRGKIYRKVDTHVY